MNFHPIWPVIYAQSNSTGRISNLTGHEILVKLGWNSWIYTQFNWAWNTAQIGLKFNGFTPNSTGLIYSQFDRSNSTGQIGSKWGHEILLKLGWNPMDLLHIWPVESGVHGGMKYCSNWVEIHGFTPNSTGHEILLKLGWNSMDLLPIRPVEFTPNSTGQIGSKWGHEILLKLGWNSLGLHCMPAWLNWVSSQWIYTQFDQYFMPGQIWNLTGHRLLVKLGGNSLKLHHHLMKNKYKVTQYIWSRFGQQIGQFY